MRSKSVMRPVVEAARRPQQPAPACRACASPAAWCWPPGRRRPEGSSQPSARQAGIGRYAIQRRKLPRQCMQPTRHRLTVQARSRGTAACWHHAHCFPPMLTWDTSLGVRMPATTSSPCKGK